MNILIDLFCTFAKIGLFTFGGGYAMIAVMEGICVERKKWISHEDMMNIAVIAESTPGPIAINCATFVGWKQKGFWGALAATFGVVMPSFLVIYIISVWMERYLDYPLVIHGFRGIQAAVGILIVDAAVKMIGKMKKKPLPVGIMICAALVMLCADFAGLRISSVMLMLTAGVFSVVFFRCQTKGKGGAKEK